MVGLGRRPEELAAWARELAPHLPQNLLERLYLPLCRLLVARGQRAAARSEPELVSLSGLPGTGKSTLVSVLDTLLARLGVRACGFSLDDVYLTRAERNALAERVHPLLAQRGVPGTHDLELAARTLDALLRAEEGGKVPLPRFDKLLDDRAPIATWPVFVGRPHVVFVDGWFWGSAPPPDASPGKPMNAREAREDPDGRFREYVAKALAQGYPALFAQPRLNVHLRAPDHETSVRWRIEQGRAELASRGHDPETHDAARTRRFLDLFQRVGTWPRAAGPELSVALDDTHDCASVTPSSELVAEWQHALRGDDTASNA
jgi:D-glycerate 3-kinase